MNSAAAMLARDFATDVFGSHSQLLLAVRTGDEEGLRANAGARNIERELPAAKLAGDRTACVLLADPQLLVAMRTQDVITGNRNFNHVGDLREFEEVGDSRAARLELGIEQRSAELTVYEFGRHVLSTVRTRATGPSRHNASHFGL